MGDVEVLLEESEPRPRRLPFVDVARGVTMATMLIVDVAGDGFPTWMGHGDGFTESSLHLADYVMPSFLFLSGFSSILSIRRDERAGDGTWKTFERAAKLFALGIVVQGKWLPDTPGRKDSVKLWTGLDLSSFRVMGILQRVALCNLVCSLLVSKVRDLQQQGAVIAVVVSAFAMLTYAPAVPGCPRAGMLSLDCNTAGWLDTVLFGDNHVYINSTRVATITSESAAKFGFDPEGLLTTLGAICTTYHGCLCAQRLFMRRRKGRVSWRKETYFSSATALLVGVVLAQGAQVPINKKLWTLSYLALTAAVSSLLLAITHDLCSLLRFAAPPRVSADPQPPCDALETAEEADSGSSEEEVGRGRGEEEDSVGWWRGAGWRVCGWMEGLGANPLLFFVGSDCCGVLSVLLGSIKLCGGGGGAAAEQCPSGCVDVVWWWRVALLQERAGLGEAWGGLVYAVMQLGLWLWICRALCDRGWFFKL